MKNLKSILIMPFLICFVACSNGGGGSGGNKGLGGGNASDFEGATVGVEINQAIVDKKANKPINQICQTLENEYGQDNYQSMNISYANKGVVYECPFKANWRNACTKLGTYIGNQFTFADNNTTLVLELTKTDSTTLKITKITSQGKELDIDKTIPDEKDRTNKKVSDTEIDEFINITKDCNITIN
jgi:hypothetical protein